MFVSVVLQFLLKCRSYFVLASSGLHFHVPNKSKVEISGPACVKIFRARNRFYVHNFLSRDILFLNSFGILNVNSLNTLGKFVLRQCETTTSRWVNGF